MAIRKGSTLDDQTDSERRHSPTPTGLKSLLVCRTTSGRRWMDIPPSPLRRLGYFRREGCALDQKFVAIHLSAFYLWLASPCLADLLQ